jgi:phosphomannomutase
LLLIIYHYLHEVRGQSGGVVRNIATTHLLDRMAKRFGEPCIEVPVGFKYISQAMQAHRALLGGESSGGLTIRGHILGKDGVLASALITEMIARTGKHISELVQDAYALTGRLYAVEKNVPATPEMRIIVPNVLHDAAVTEVLGEPVASLSHLDGFKYNLPNDNWVLLRFSGTEALLRIFAEADTPKKAQRLVDWGADLIAVE